MTSRGMPLQHGSEEQDLSRFLHHFLQWLIQALAERLRLIFHKEKTSSEIFITLKLY